MFQSGQLSQAGGFATVLTGEPLEGFSAESLRELAALCFQLELFPAAVELYSAICDRGNPGELALYRLGISCLKLGHLYKVRGGNREHAVQAPFHKGHFCHLVQALQHIEFESTVQRVGTATPVFIVGLPRSGTTLIEQILSSHSKVRATDELPFMERMALELERSGGLRQYIAHLVGFKY